MAIFSDGIDRNIGQLVFIQTQDDLVAFQLIEAVRCTNPESAVAGGKRTDRDGANVNNCTERIFKPINFCRGQNNSFAAGSGSDEVDLKFRESLLRGKIIENAIDQMPGPKPRFGHPETAISRRPHIGN